MIGEKSRTGTAVVIGAGTMGGGIAALLANAGWQVRLLDVPGPDPADPKTRSAAAKAGWERLQAAKPPLLYLPEFAGRIQIGNMEDNLDALGRADWVVEAVIENEDVKHDLLALIEQYAGAYTVVSSNTSGLSLRVLTDGRSAGFKSRFLGTHFLNPPRYLKLLELIPLPETDPDVFQGFRQFAETVLGRRAVEARDTPGFISTRLGITHLLDSIHLAIEQKITLEEADYLTGPLIGRPRSGTFRLADLVGLDILAHIADHQRRYLPDDPLSARLILPPALSNLLQSGMTGAKAGAGFYKRDATAHLALDLATGTYRPQRAVRIDAVEELLLRPLPERLPALRRHAGTPWGGFVNTVLDSLTAYAEAIAPQIAGDARSIDRVMEWGFGWEIGPLQISDLRRDAAVGARYFQGVGEGRLFRAFADCSWRVPEPEPQFLSLAQLKADGRTVLDAPEASLIDLGDGVACLEFHTKMNTFDPALTDFVRQARARAEQDFLALVIGNQGSHFSAGYNLGLFLQAMEAKEWSRIDEMLHDVQFAFLELKYAAIPVVAAPHGYTLGAGCEGALHCHAIQAAPELWMGLPELRVGVIPAGGGTKEMLARAMTDWDGVGDAFPAVERVFDVIALPHNSGSAEEARRMGFLRPVDGISAGADRQLYEAKQRALALAEDGWRPPVRQGVWVLGEETLARLRMKIHNLHRAGQLSDHDRLIADRIGFVLSGGDLPYPQTVSEEYLLQLERDVFIELAHEPKSAERMRHVLNTGKPLKN